MFKYDYAVELGTTNTVIYKAGMGVVLKEPTLIAISSDGKRKLLKCVGVLAKQLIGKSGSGVEVFEPVVEGVIINRQLASTLLKEFFKKVTKTKLSKLKVVFCVAVGLTAAERSTLVNLAYSLNFHTAKLVPSSVASLVGMGLDVLAPNSHLVVNLGGGVSDIAIVTGGNIVRGGSVTLSGRTLGGAIDQMLRVKHSIMVTHEVRAEIFKELVSLYENDNNQLAVWGLDVDTKSRKEITLKALDVHEIAKDFFNQLVETVQTMVHLSSTEVIADINRYGVFVCGGLSHVTGLEKFLRENLKIPVHIDADGGMTTIYGAGEIIENQTLFEVAVSNFK